MLACSKLFSMLEINLIRFTYAKYDDMALKEYDDIKVVSQTVITCRV